MNDRIPGVAGASLTALLGVGLAAGAVVAAMESGETVAAALPAVLGLAVAGGGVRVQWRADPAFVRRVVRWVAVACLVPASAAVWVVAFAGVTFDPVVATGAMAGAALVGLGMGAQDAEVVERERELRAERDRLAALFEDLSAPVAEFEHREGRPAVRATNAAFAETFGTDLESLPPTVAPAAHADDVETVELDGQDGGRTYVRLTAPVNERAVHAVYVDVTDRTSGDAGALASALSRNVVEATSEIERELDDLGDAVDEDATDRVERLSNRVAALRTTAERARTVQETLADETVTRPVDVGAAVRTAVPQFGQRHPDATVETDVTEGVLVDATDAVRAIVAESLVYAAGDGNATIEVTLTEDEEGVTLRVESDATPTRNLQLVETAVAALGGDLDVEVVDGATVTVHLPGAY